LGGTQDSGTINARSRPNAEVIRNAVAVHLLSRRL
jgi:hypothetical protein